jgi:hypothetical protein
MRYLLLPLLFSLLLGPLSAQTEPSFYANMGVLGKMGTPTAPVQETYNMDDFAPGQVKWYRLKIPDVPLVAEGMFLDVYTAQDASSSEPASSPDTEIALYSPTGDLLMQDDDEGAYNFSALSWGRSDAPRSYTAASPTGATDVVAFNGRDKVGAAATLPPGVYWLAVARYNATFGSTSWTASSTSTSSVNNRVKLHIGYGGRSAYELGPVAFLGDPARPVKNELRNLAFPVNSVVWATFELREPVQRIAGANRFFDIFTQEEAPGGAYLDPKLGLYSNDGTLLTQNDDLSVYQAGLAFGSDPNIASMPRYTGDPGVDKNMASRLNVVTTSGPHVNLVPGRYWIAMTHFGVDFLQDFAYQTTSSATVAPAYRLTLGSFRSSMPSETVYSVGEPTKRDYFYPAVDAQGVSWMSVDVPYETTAVDGRYLDFLTSRTNAAGVAEDTLLYLYNERGNIVVSDDDSGYGQYSQLTFSPATLPARPHPYPVPTPTNQADPLDGRNLSTGLPAGRYFLAMAKYPVTLGPGTFNIRSADPSPALQNSRMTALWGGVSAYEAWKGEKFLARGRDTGIGGDAADPDKDGVANAIEFKLGEDPNITDSIRPLHTWTVPGHPFIYFHYLERFPLSREEPNGPLPLPFGLKVQRKANMADASAWIDLPEYDHVLPGVPPVTSATSFVLTAESGTTPDPQGNYVPIAGRLLFGRVEVWADYRLRVGRYYTGSGPKGFLRLVAK